MTYFVLERRYTNSWSRKRGGFYWERRKV